MKFVVWFVSYLNVDLYKLHEMQAMDEGGSSRLA